MPRKKKEPLKTSESALARTVPSGEVEENGALARTVPGECTTVVQKKTRRPPGDHRVSQRSKIDNEGTRKALLALQGGVRPGDVARMLGVAPSTITALKKRFGAVFSEMSNIQDYRKLKSEMLDSAELLTLKSACAAASRKPGLRESSIAFKVFHDAGRLERGQSTKIVETRTKFTVFVSPDHEAPLDDQGDIIDVTPAQN